MRAFFTELKALVDAIEQTLGNPRYVDISQQERAKREKLDLELITYLKIRDNDIVIPAAVKKLLDQGADPNAIVIKDYENALMLACESDNHEVVKILLDAGALSDAIRPRQNGKTALMHAAQHYSWRSVKVLLQRGVEATVVNIWGENALMMATGKYAELTGLTLEEYANMEDRMRRMFILLLDAGIDVNAISKKGETALSKAEFEDQKLAVGVLKEMGAEL